MSTNDFDDEFDETADPVDDEPEGGDEDIVLDAESGEPAPKEKDIDLTDAETLTVSSKEAARRQLEEDMERFLASGGRIREIPPDESADPPKRPTSSYGSKPI
ncbi:hypothetical protein [Agitococcus lubricus]|uniref:Transcriptional regulator SutA RNAP-binding domain-containing protein n=1 Tax=Agitococcus lubricus TaxID=1077255 RepID=A0A2T5IVF7_9GAMM|nr:hypothetical protein [Agitococcus lubricus]PTQ87859.1 hypothetical protein C8N29_11625 [Agitococcus lubricus]